MGWGHEGKVTTPQEEEKEDFPPKYAYLMLQTGDYQAAFCDSRKFGKTELRTDLGPLEALAPDAWLGDAATIAASVTQQSTGIKALLLDQKRACSGVGNWVADEVLYQCHMHPDQAFLATDEATRLVQTTQSILATAVDCLAQHVPYPSDWLFGYRWTKKKAGKDAQGRSITFVQSGGRTTAMIASQQKLYKRKRVAAGGETNNCGKKPAKKKVKKQVVEDEHNVKPNHVKASTEKKASSRRASSLKRVKDEADNNNHAEESNVSSDVKNQSNGQSTTRRTKPKTAKKADAAASAKSSSPDQLTRRRSPRFVSP